MRIDIVGRYLPKDPTRRKWMKRRAAIEPLIGYLKNDNGYRRNHLKGTIGDKLAAVLSTCGYNLRQCLRAIARRLALFLASMNLISYLPWRTSAAVRSSSKLPRDRFAGATP